MTQPVQIDAYPTTITPQLAADIRARREALGWSQEDLAEVLNSHSSNVSKIELQRVDESELLPDILALLDAGELPEPDGPQPVGRCETCQILLYESEEALPDGMPAIMVWTSGKCRACVMEEADDAS